MSTEYWIRTSVDGTRRGLMRVTKTATTLRGDYVNGDGEWEQDNSRVAELGGAGGDVDWALVPRKEAQSFLDEFAPLLRL